jgi:VWFA-related protein
MRNNIIFRSIWVGILICTILLPAGDLPLLARTNGPTQPPQAAPPAQAPSQPSQAAPPPQQQQQQQPPSGGYTMSVTIPVVNLDVVVTDENGNPITNFKQENFRVLEDGAPQTITNFGSTNAPITIVMLLEFSQLGGGLFAYNGMNWAAGFLSQLKPTDWVALMTYSMNTQVEVDFTHDPNAILQSLSTLMFPPFHEANMFDAISDTLDRLKDVKGKKAILLMGSGLDTFSRLTLDKMMSRMKETDVTFFSISTAGANNFGGQPESMNFLQAQNELRTFAQLTGGRAWFPNFDGEIPGILQQIAASLRNQYSLAYTPTNRALDGKYRKIKVEMVAPDGGPLTVLDQKGKKVKYVIYARAGYTAPKSNVGD